MNISKSSRVFLLQLARQSIEHYLAQNRYLHVVLSHIPKELHVSHSAFVTLTKDGELRGCIGSLTPSRPLYQEVLENAVSAAVYDSRFPEVCEAELPDLRIEISVLSPAIVYPYGSVQELQHLLASDHPGVVLKKGHQSATFLPQVWEQLPEVDVFLSHLCTKAGLPSSEWEKGNLEISTYTVVKFEE